MELPWWWGNDLVWRLYLLQDRDLEVTVRIGEKDVVAWTLQLNRIDAKANLPNLMTENEVRAAAKTLIIERGVKLFYLRRMKGRLNHLTEEDLWMQVLKDRKAHHEMVTERVLILPTDALCDRTDGFCAYAMETRDCRYCTFYNG